MSTFIGLHKVAKTTMSEVRENDMSGKPFWTRTITATYEDGTEQQVVLYSDLDGALYFGATA